MGLFDSKANIAQIINEEKINNRAEQERISKNEVFIWKADCEDFSIGTQLIVHESQEAVFFMNGQALDLFGPGRYTLETQNIPLLKKALNWSTNGENAFHCEVYYVNKVVQMAIKWGTDSKIEYMEPEYKFPVAIGASGEMGLQVENSRKLLVKLVGTGKVITRETIVQYFRGIMQGKIKSYLAKIMREKAISIFEVDEHLDEFSIELQELLQEEFAEYGVRLCKFVVNVIKKPEEDRLFIRFKELHIRKYTDLEEAKLRQKVALIEQETDMQKIIMEAHGISTKRKLEGYTYQDERGYDVAEKMAENEAKGEFANAGLGMAMMTGVGGGVAFKTTELVAEAMKKTQSVPEESIKLTIADTQGQQNIVTGETTEKREKTMEEFSAKLERLKLMREKGILNEEEFMAQKQKLLEIF